MHFGADGTNETLGGRKLKLLERMGALQLSFLSGTGMLAKTLMFQTCGARQEFTLR